MEKCQARTPRFNCGCCEETIFECDKPEGHTGKHRDSSWASYSTSKNPYHYPVIWWDDAE